MGVLKKEYNVETHVDEVWYESSNVVYSRFVEDEEDNFGDLYVVFKGGKQYLYKKVPYTDYLSFKGGFVEGSSGKAFNEYIIKKYKGEKIDDADVTELQNRLMSPEERYTTYFIHGNGDFDNDILTMLYVPTIEHFIEMSEDSRFITKMYDRYGFEAAKYMIENGVDASKFTIYMRRSDEVTFVLLEELSGCKTVMVKDDDWDDALVDGLIRGCTVDDIAYVSPDELDRIREVSRSAYNILKRRFE